MKKQNLKNYLKLGILFFGISLFVTNCEKDYTNEIEIQTHSRFKVKILNQKQVNSNKQIAEKLKKVDLKIKRKTNSVFSKEIYNEEYDFTINTDYVKYLEDTENGNHSYNFLISRENPEDDKLENLLLILNSEGNYDAYLVKYDFSIEEYSNIDQNTLNSRTTTYMPIDFDISVFNEGELAKVTPNLVCVEVWVQTTVPTDEGNNTGNTDLYETIWVLESSTCTWIGGGGGDSDGTTGGAEDPGGDETSDNCDTCGSSGGNGGTPSPPDEEEPGTIISVPTTMSIDDVENCEKLKNLSDVDEQNINVQIQFLKDKLATNPENEWSVQMTKDVIGNYIAGEDNEFEYTSTQEEGNENSSTLISGEYYYAGAHLHTNKGYGIFSWADVRILGELLNNAISYNRPFVTSILVCENPNNSNNPFVYALKVDDMTKFNNSIYAVWSNSKYSELSDTDKINKILNEEALSFHENKDDLEKYFLNKYSNAGISLYKADNDMSNWNKLTLQDDTNGTEVVTSIPCAD